ncbi:ABC transporter permease [Paraburkholderia sp. SIMBA_055]|jgi:putative spermidine/putrescine transport system permease protein|uniref:Binding-protein-dependent transport systems inner membrane component n=4 Tax=Burkholderiaceae TaxID=119060 RepID=B1FZT9_PARG4|nr:MULTISPECIES: ABC transporter permease [Paraburkholderia]ALE57516.1 ABC transporter permease [Burkholderia sp. HB1]AXF10227.1 ABC transporter permease [Paraburkholderia graminis]EDT10526.1 binding-protein-dependent transport systems inner membrane component [Paraburkholderia graminis C4D1M]MDQ0624672.1 putative spermidine/putrescine transport system permease protein [Paraburkholderia graminis]MDR6205830.1 putative spermidine/putrescine transport system permease protein [Paraburkholderia gra
MNRIPLGRVVLGAFVVLILVFLMLPVLIVVPLSFSDTRFMTFPPPAYSLRWYHAFFDNPAWIDAARVTLTASVCAALVATPLGVAAAYAIQHGTHWSMRYLRTLLMLPLMVPIIIVAVGVFFVFTQAGYVNTLGGLIVADTMLGLPYVLISVGADLRTFDRTQEMVARSLGMNRLRSFLTVTLPQIKASVISGAVFVFIQALDETVVALFISGGANQTLTRRMFVTLRDEIDPTIAAISTMLTALTLCLVMIVVVSRRSAGARA